MTMSTSERRERDKNRRRDEIIQAAELVFAEKGFEAAGMAEIARRAELSKGAVYLYFRGKHDLAFALFEQSLAELLEALTRAVDAAPRGIDKVRALTQAFLDFYRTKAAGFTQQSFSLFFNSAHMHNPSAEACMRILEKLLQLSIGIVDAGLRDGSIRGELDPVKTALTYSNLVLSYLMRNHLGPDLTITGVKLRPDELLEYMFNLLIRAVEQRSDS
jgi:TetR/AcrR family transcriptional regulator